MGMEWGVTMNETLFREIVVNGSQQLGPHEWTLQDFGEVFVFLMVVFVLYWWVDRMAHKKRKKVGA
jgi:hypothetical protein